MKKSYILWIKLICLEKKKQRESNSEPAVANDALHFTVNIKFQAESIL